MPIMLSHHRPEFLFGTILLVATLLPYSLSAQQVNPSRISAEPEALAPAESNLDTHEASRNNMNDNLDRVKDSMSTSERKTPQMMRPFLKAGKKLKKEMHYLKERAKDVLPYYKKTTVETGYPHPAIIRAGRQGNIELVVKLLKKDFSGKMLELTDDKGMTVLMWASLNGNEKLVALLLRKKWYKRLFSSSKHVEMVNNDGWSALMLASKMNHPAIVRLLLEHLTNPQHLFQRSHESATSALSTACSNGHIEVVKLLLLSNSNLEHVRLPNQMGSTPLMLASYYGHLNIVQRLLKVDQEGLSERDQDGCIALMYACAASRLRVAVLLLVGGVPNDASPVTSTFWTGQMQVRDDQGMSALMFASMDGSSEIVKLLLSEGGNAQVNYVSWSQETALYHACANGHVSVVERLLEAHESDSGDSVVPGSTTHHLHPVKSNRSDSVWAIQLSNDVGCTPLFAASANGHLRVVGLLLEKLGRYSADTIRIQNDDGHTALVAASANGHVDIVRRLIAADPSIETLLMNDSEGRAALAVAEINNHRDVERVLKEEWRLGRFNSSFSDRGL